MTARPPVPISPEALPPPEVFAVDGRRVACDGVGGALGHPLVWLDMGGKPFVDCGYCDRRFTAGGTVGSRPYDDPSPRPLGDH